MTDSSPAAPPSAPSPIAQLFAIVGGPIRFHVLGTAAELELADQLANGPLSLDELASRTNTHGPSLFRLLRALESIGVFKEVSPRVFANTPVSELLRKEAPGSSWAHVRGVSPGGGLYESWAGFTHSIRTGKTAFDHVHGCTIWEFMGRNPEKAATFDQGMRAVQTSMTTAVTVVWDWSRFPVIADIGGGIGGQLVDILNAHASCRGILFDQPDVIARAIRHDRVERVAGNFFERVPSGADAYILRSVIHDWGDAESVGILKAVRAAAKTDSRVILIEHVLPETPEYALSKWADVAMLAYSGGQERTAAEYRQLLEKAGFELEQIVSTPTGPSLIISRPRA